MGIILDTHALIWLVKGDKTLSQSAIKEFSRASQRGDVFLASISLWEISMLAQKKRILLELPCQDWIEKAISVAKVEIVTLTPKIAVESCQLPGQFHGDPADRLIVASARVQGLAVVTRDDRILEYSSQRYVSAVKA